MKALDILNRLQDEQPMYFENEVAEAIAELEALQEQKTCEGCKYDNPHWFNEYCGHCEREKYCDYYEPKDA